MVEYLASVAERIKSNSGVITSVEKVNVVDGALYNRTYVDFKTNGFGIDWSETDDFGGWQPTACEAKEDKVYRVWFHKDDRIVINVDGYDSEEVEAVGDLLDALSE